MKMPKTLAGCADLMYKTRQDRLALQKRVDELKSEENELAEHLIQNLPKANAQGITGKLINATIKDKEIVELYGTEEDRFSKVYEYILKNAKRDPGVWALMQRRVSDTAAKELIEAGKGALIGARLGTVPFVSLTKPK